jgi:outer membrane biogenesis lipoprotein LolB
MNVYVSAIMKLQRLFFVGFVSFVLFACAKEKEVMVQAPDPAKRVHTQEELKKTGRSEVGPALEQVDPAVESSRKP